MQMNETELPELGVGEQNNEATRDGERPIFQPLNLINEQCREILNNELNRTGENFGTHWLAEIIYMLLNKRLEYNTEYVKVSAMLPLQTPEMVDKLSSPRILNSHLLFSSLPRDILTQKNKVVFVNRNPKDVAVSLYHFCRHTINYEGSWNDFLQLFMSERGMVYSGPWHKYMMDWDNVIKDNSKLDVLVVNYEDLKMAR
ncbi:Hypothetical predicted protein [Mytilus galloprovincialis]|uniref:Sulfotransferase domain-containing protein n=1 Tax=Mytilus galloprovincialis TaxID=29158 RepID=A0A8B6CZJ6_MYTGA|nr:Hypothetical predicted protein [Mytilus galloprovincialis]